MTNEEAIEIIECGDISNRWGKDGEEVEKMAIEALEQREKTDVLDKIRAEIEIKRDRAKTLNMVLQMNAYTDCLQIIDKYREVSE